MLINARFCNSRLLKKGCSSNTGSVSANLHHVVVDGDSNRSVNIYLPQYAVFAVTVVVLFAVGCLDITLTILCCAAYWLFPSDYWVISDTGWLTVNITVDFFFKIQFSALCPFLIRKLSSIQWQIWINVHLMCDTVTWFAKIFCCTQQTACCVLGV